MAGEKILIVDDNPLNLKLARVVLSADGFDVVTATDAMEAQAVLQRFHPELIIMDIQLPGIDGLELTRQLKSASTTKEIMVVALTSYAMQGDREKALAAGCEGYLTKPIDTRVLGSTISSFLMSRSQG